MNPPLPQMPEPVPMTDQQFLETMRRWRYNLVTDSTKVLTADRAAYIQGLLTVAEKAIELVEAKIATEKANREAPMPNWPIFL